MRIHENMLLDSILETNPGIAEVFKKHGLFCDSCPGAVMENLREAAEGHGIDLQLLIEDLNNFINENK